MSDMDDRGLGQYDDTNRAFLQGLMARGSITFREGQKLLAAILSAKGEENTEDGSISEDDVESYIAAASEAISPYDFEIRSAVHQSTKEKYWALINLTSDAVTQLATLRTPDEMSYVKRVLDLMFDKFNTPRVEAMAVTSMQALKAARAPNRDEEDDDVEEGMVRPTDKGLVATQAEKVLADLVEEGWFERSAEGFYSLAPRALLELRPWLVATYNDPDADANEFQRIKNCAACKELLTTGVKCGNLDCDIRLHGICHKGFMRGKGGKCPKCKADWKPWHVGEKAVTETKAYKTGRRISGVARRQTDGAGDTDHDADDDQVMVMSEDGN